MPIFIDPDAGPPIIPSPPQPDANRSFSMELIGRDDSIFLTTRDTLSGFYLTRGSQGFDMPSIDVFSDPLPSDDGDFFRSMRYKTREIFLPIFTYGPSQPQARAIQRRLFSILDAKKGVVTIKVTQYDGTSRLIDGMYSGGSEGNWGSSNWYKWWSLIGVNIRCFTPYFRDAAPFVELFTLAETAPNPLLGAGHNFFPMQLSSSQIDFTNVPISNTGDIDTFPTWKITGPMTGITIELNSTGQSFQLGAITAGHSITVVTERPNQTIKDETGANKWSSLTPSSVLFSIPPGDSTLNVTGIDVTSASSIELSFIQRYLVA